MLEIFHSRPAQSVMDRTAHHAEDGTDNTLSEVRKTGGDHTASICLH